MLTEAAPKWDPNSNAYAAEQGLGCAEVLLTFVIALGHVRDGFRVAHLHSPEEVGEVCNQPHAHFSLSNIKSKTGFISSIL